MMQHWSIRLCIMLVLLVTLATAAAGPDLAGKRIGTSNTVLPGFEPINRRDDTLHLYARTYQWSGSILPVSMTSRGKPLVECFLTITDASGTVTVLAADETAWTDKMPGATEYRASGRHEALGFRIRSVIEYDGFVDSTLTIDAAQAPVSGTIELVFRVHDNSNSEILAFRSAGIRRQKDRDDFIVPPYRGDFLNAVTIADGDRSFWWVADSAEGWSGTAITAHESTMEMRQQLATVPAEGSQPVSVRFGLLATPVRPIGTKWRTEYASSGNPSLLEYSLGTRFKLWWPTAFAYDTFPYTNLRNATPNRLTPKDLAAYPGLEKNARLIRNARSDFDIHVLPYFSAHALSLLDPVARQFRDVWEIQPEWIFRGGVGPYSDRYDKPTLSHNAPGYTDYLLARFDKLIDELPIEGVYLDHGPVWDSTRSAHGGWTDAAGKSRPALDIFATRAFLKRLRNLFAEKNRDGYIFVHASNREIIPAYTFAHAIVDGEQYKRRVADANYLKLVTPAEFRTRFSPGQYGVLNYFLPSDWSNHAGDSAWRGSENQRLTYRRAMGLALVHDVPLWQHGYHAGEREKLLRLVDRFGIDEAEFHGYWTGNTLLASDSASVLISEYRNNGRRLNVVLNAQDRAIRVSLGIPGAGNPGCNAPRRDRRLTDATIDSNANEFALTADIDAFDFAIVTFRDANGCPGAEERPPG